MTRAEREKMLQPKLDRLRELAGTKSAREIAPELGWPEATCHYYAHKLKISLACSDSKARQMRKPIRRDPEPVQTATSVLDRFWRIPRSAKTHRLGNFTQ